MIHRLLLALTLALFAFAALDSRATHSTTPETAAAAHSSAS
jgi:hypothetical protein